MNKKKSNFRTRKNPRPENFSLSKFILITTDKHGKGLNSVFGIQTLEATILSLITMYEAEMWDCTNQKSQQASSSKNGSLKREQERVKIGKIHSKVIRDTMNIKSIKV